MEAVLFAFFEESFAADAEDCGGLADLIASGVERGSDGFAFDLLEGT